MLLSTEEEGEIYKATETTLSLFRFVIVFAMKTQAP